jgi:tetratricopeptide (TPR) repeat protein
MGREDWYRNSTWSPEDQAAFHARLKRSRGSFHKSQYLRIQALYLAKAGNHLASLELLDQLLREHPDPSQLSTAYLQRAESLLALGRLEEAVVEFRNSLQAEKDHPGVQTGTWIEFPWHIAVMGLEHLYDEALSLIDRSRLGDGLIFPVLRFRYSASLALIAGARGERSAARMFAEEALKSANANHSGFRYHPDFGLVGEVDPQIWNRLVALTA